MLSKCILKTTEVLHRRGHTNTKHRISGLPYPHHCRKVCTRRPRRSLNHWQDANYLSNATHICLLLTQRAAVHDRGLAPLVQPTSERTSASPHLTGDPSCATLYRSLDEWWHHWCYSFGPAPQLQATATVPAIAARTRRRPTDRRRRNPGVEANPSDVVPPTGKVTWSPTGAMMALAAVAASPASTKGSATYFMLSSAKRE